MSKFEFPNAQSHAFKGCNDNMAICSRCGSHIANHTEFEIPIGGGGSPVDALLQSFPAMIDEILRTKRTEQVRSDIARITAALIISGKEDANSAVDTACYLYERLEAATHDWGKK